jgi:rhamnulokinase
MTSRTTVAAIDLGAESGRVTTAGFDGQALHLDVTHRFAHTPYERDGVMRWDIDSLWSEIRDGLAMLDGADTRVTSVGVDAWGVDYGLVDASGALVDTPTCYRDPRNVRAMHEAIAQVGADVLYHATGVQIIPINTLFSLIDDVRRQDRLAGAAKLLMMPDVFHHLLSGSMVTEYTAASTTGALNMRTGCWEVPLLDTFAIPSSLVPDVVPPGTDVGALLGGYSGGLRDCRVVTPAAHDTASAVVGVPVRHPGEMFISSGTWSLVGVESQQAVISAASRTANLTNEGGFAGTIRLLRNVMGLWILQNCRRHWAREGHQLSYAEIADLAAREPGLRSLINPDCEEFLGPGDMPRRIQSYCARAGVPVPQSVGQVARCVIDSLALSYREVARSIGEVTGTPPPAVNIVGGGSRHALLSQLTSDATGLPVRCGPVEATALGNAAVQLTAAGELSGLDDIRRVIAASTRIEEYRPRVHDDWDAAAERFARLVSVDLDRAGVVPSDARAGQP